MGISEYKFKRYRWAIDYPILSYSSYDNKKITMVHLADPDAQKHEIEMKDKELFVAFAERFPGCN